MPQKRRFRRLGSTSAAVSFGAITLVVTAAGPASAGTAEDCPRGSGPVTTLQNVPCRLEAITGDVTAITGDVIDDLTSGIDRAGDGAAPARPPAKATRPRSAPRAPAPRRSSGPHETPFTVSGVPPVRLPRPDGTLPAEQPDLANLFPQPHVAAAPQPRAAAQ